MTAKSLKYPICMNIIISVERRTYILQAEGKYETIPNEFNISTYEFPAFLILCNKKQLIITHIFDITYIIPYNMFDSINLEQKDPTIFTNLDGTKFYKDLAIIDKIISARLILK